MKALEKLIETYETKITKLEKSSDLDYKNNNMPLSAAKQMTAEYLKTAISDIKRAMAADTGEKQCNLPVVIASTWVFFYEGEEDKPQFKVQAKAQWEAYQAAEEHFGIQVEDMMYKML